MFSSVVNQRKTVNQGPSCALLKLGLVLQTRNSAVFKDELAGVGSPHAQLVQLLCGGETRHSLYDRLFRAFLWGCPHRSLDLFCLWTDPETNARIYLFHNERCDASLMCSWIRLCINNQNIGIGAVGDPELVPVQNIIVAWEHKLEWIIIQKFRGFLIAGAFFVLHKPHWSGTLFQNSKRSLWNSHNKSIKKPQHKSMQRCYTFNIWTERLWRGISFKW